MTRRVRPGTSRWRARPGARRGGCSSTRPSARDSAMSAATEGCRSPDSRRDRWAVERSARCGQLLEREAGAGAFLAQAFGDRRERFLELHRPIVQPGACLRGKRICQSLRTGNVRETAPRFIPLCPGDQRGESVEHQLLPGTEPLERLRCGAAHRRRAARRVDRPRRRTTSMNASTASAVTSRWNWRPHAASPDPERLVLIAARCPPGTPTRAAVRTCRHASAARRCDGAARQERVVGGVAASSSTGAQPISGPDSPGRTRSPCRRARAAARRGRRPAWASPILMASDNNASSARRLAKSSSDDADIGPPITTMPS